MQSLRVTLLIDSLVCFAYGAALVLAYEPLAALFTNQALTVLGVPFPQFLRLLGVVVLLVGVGVYTVARSRTIRPAAVWPIIAVEVGWALGSIMFLLNSWEQLSPAGIGFTLLSAGVVFGFMMLELSGLRALRGVTTPTSQQGITPHS